MFPIEKREKLCKIMKNLKITFFLPIHCDKEGGGKVCRVKVFFDFVTNSDNVCVCVCVCGWGSSRKKCLCSRTMFMETPQGKWDCVKKSGMSWLRAIVNRLLEGPKGPQHILNASSLNTSSTIKSPLPLQHQLHTSAHTSKHLCASATASQPIWEQS
jgi:hypothetical protein